jgi:N6-adenosine-specific RNA methylase IME4
MHSIEEVEALGGYAIVYADPCWSYNQRGRGAAENHYRTMSVEEIAALPVSRIAAKNAALFLWGTWPNLFECKTVIEGWGFRFKTLAFLWVKCEKSGKTFWGGGSYSRANSEFCLLAMRGKMSAVSHSVHQLVEEWDERDDLVLRAPIGRHSAKPVAVRERIVELFGDLPRIELFARERVPGWDAFGNDPALGGPDVDLIPQQRQQEEERRTIIYMNEYQQDQNTHTNDSITNEETNNSQGEENMGQMPESVRQRIAKSRANAGGNNIRYGEYILMYWKSSYDRMNSGNCHINEFVVVQAKKIVVMEGDKQKDVEPNQVGTMCSYVINYDGKGKLSADGNSKSIVLGLFGIEEKPDDAQQQEELMQALADLTSDAQPAKGMLIKLETYPKEVRSRPGNYITGMKWSCVDPLGTGENIVEKAAERVKQFQVMQSQ